jgi:hypothetical protein
MVLIGFFFARRNASTKDFYLGGRSLGPFVTAMSAEASDMSSYLLMGLPGLAYLSGLADVGWTVIGLGIGTYLNWLLVAKRLRTYSAKVDAITVPDYLARRFRDNLTMVATLPLLNNLADYQLRAYVGDELRGVGHAGDADRVFVTVHADGGECVSFHLADLCTGIEYAVDETVIVAQPRLGSLRQPVALHATGLTQGIADLPMESTATSPAQCYDLQGRSLLPSSHAKGLIIRRTANGSFRKVIQR